MSEKILVVAPHPDDETLGCGGTLLRHKDQGEQIYWMVMTNIHVEHGWDKNKVESRQREIEEVAAMYGMEHVYNLGFPTTTLDRIPYNEMIDKVSKVVKEVKPTVVYVPNQKDIHSDHAMTFNVTLSCCKDFRAPFIKRILMYEVLSETDFAPEINELGFRPNVFVDVSKFMEKKLEIFQIYASEVMAAPLPRSLETLRSLAQYRGSRISKNYAEAFCLIFEKR